MLHSLMPSHCPLTVGRTSTEQPRLLLRLAVHLLAFIRPKRALSIEIDELHSALKVSPRQTSSSIWLTSIEQKQQFADVRNAIRADKMVSPSDTGQRTNEN